MKIIGRMEMELQFGGQGTVSDMMENGFMGIWRGKLNILNEVEILLKENLKTINIIKVLTQ